jgi:hypothetical protein
MILESAVERHAECVFYRDWQGAMRNNSRSIVTIRNTASRDKKRALRVVAAHPTGELRYFTWVIGFIMLGSYLSDQLRIPG